MNDEKFIWWCRGGSGTEVRLSPADDKTSIITVAFPCDYDEEFVIGIRMTRGDEECCIKVLEPQMAGLLAAYLSEHKMFIPRRNTMINGYDLLSEMGYSICEVKKGWYW